ncbi:MAG: HEPN domain-containing protein [Candidatus Methanoperedens sp.]|nr:HEPN domain-containing protein [Candidatus Methanoperedens sp.]
MRKEIDYWFEQAKADMKSAEDLLKTKNFYASVFFS